MIANWKMILVISFILSVNIGWSALEHDVKTHTISYKSGEEEVSAFLARPEGEGPFPAIIVIHEWWGLTDWVKNNAEDFAKKGYIALAVDLYRGKTADNRDVAHQLMRGLPDDQAIRDLKGAFGYLNKREDVEKEKIGCIGWCMGGGYALKAALNISDLDACVICYGRLSTDRSELENISCPILGIFGEEDQGIPPETVRKFENLLNDLGKDAEIHIYPDVGHAFMRGDEDSEATKKAWKEIHEFFNEKLMKKDLEPAEYRQ